MHLRLTSEQHRSLENNSVYHTATPNVLKSSLDLVKENRKEQKDNENHKH